MYYSKYTHTGKKTTRRKDIKKYTVFKVLVYLKKHFQASLKFQRM